MVAACTSSCRIVSSVMDMLSRSTVLVNGVYLPSAFWPLWRRLSCTRTLVRRSSGRSVAASSRTAGVEPVLASSSTASSKRPSKSASAASSEICVVTRSLYLRSSRSAASSSRSRSFSNKSCTRERGPRPTSGSSCSASAARRAASVSRRRCSGDFLRSASAALLAAAVSSRIRWSSCAAASWSSEAATLLALRISRRDSGVSRSMGFWLSTMREEALSRRWSAVSGVPVRKPLPGVVVRVAGLLVRRRVWPSVRASNSGVTGLPWVAR